MSEQSEHINRFDPEGSTWLRFWRVVAKIVLSVGIVAGAAVLVALLGTDGEVERSRAHIVDFTFGFQSDTKKFVDALDNMGHSPPKVYELNGNKVFFSTNLVDETPQDIMRDYQQEFVHQGLNSEAFTEIKDWETMERTRTGLTGGIVPVHIRDDYVAMNGVLPANGAENGEELLRRYDPQQSVSDIFDGYRWIEIFDTPKRGQSRVVASWSNAKFDFSKMEIPKTDLSKMDLPREIPLCTACSMINQFSDENVNGTHETYMFSSSQSVLQVRQFYQRRLKGKGWEMAANTEIMDELRNKIEIENERGNRLEFSKNGKHMTVGIFGNGERSTAVRVSLVDDKFLREKDLLNN